MLFGLGCLQTWQKHQLTLSLDGFWKNPWPHGSLHVKVQNIPAEGSDCIGIKTSQQENVQCALVLAHLGAPQ